MAQENRSWGYDRMVGALANLGDTISDQTVGSTFKRHGISPAPKREQTTPWKEFIRMHMDLLVATDFFTTEVWTWGGLVTYYVLFFMHLGSRRVHIAGATPYPHESWMMQRPRNMTMADWGLLEPGQYLIRDRDGKFCPAFQQLIDNADIKRVVLPPQSTNFNAFAERWIRWITDEALSRLILCGERALRHALKEHVTHFHQERPRQGKGNVSRFPEPRPARERAGAIQGHERLGGLLKYYHRQAA
jgi:hypothetical protein